MKNNQNLIKYFLLPCLMLCIGSIVCATETEGSKDFPDPQQSYLKHIQRYTLEQIRLLDKGMDKDQLRHILGNPHFNEGVFKVKTWNYVLDIYQSDSNRYERCQLKIEFDQNNIVQYYRWNSQKCQDLANI